jgi:hypothetical protein
MLRRRDLRKLATKLTNFFIKLEFYFPVFFVSFWEVFPQIAKKETRSLIIAKDPVIPADTYTFFELYCADPGCDCRMVRFSVLAESGSSHAEISYKWHEKKYYRGPFNDFEENGLPGPSCSFGAPQGPLLIFSLKDLKNYSFQMLIMLIA